ncbi:MAG: hypothetical protein JXR95_08255 [Deltaproteobacteria bacterium]|nr:hypothetical protein [Deltaproteobacteria bacterium]
MEKIKSTNAVLRPWPNVLSSSDARFYENVKNLQNKLNEEKQKLVQLEEESRVRGFQEGYQDGSRKAFELYSEIIKNSGADFVENLKKELPYVILKLIEKIISIEIKNNPRQMENIINHIASDIPDMIPVRIRLNSLHEGNIDHIWLKEKFPGGVSVVFEESFPVTDVSVFFAGKHADFSVESVLKSVEKFLK